MAGMHPLNKLGAHIVKASLPARGPGGSWCTCHLSTPYDVRAAPVLARETPPFPRHLSSSRSQVCHRQFGAQTAFKLVWCDGTRVAALVDVRHVERTSRAHDTANVSTDRAACDAWQDDGNVLSRGKPLEPTSGGGVPGHGDERARIEAWQVHGRPRFTPNCSLCELRRTSSQTA